MVAVQTDRLYELAVLLDVQTQVQVPPHCVVPVDGVGFFPDRNELREVEERQQEMLLDVDFLLQFIDGLRPFQEGEENAALQQVATHSHSQPIEADLQEQLTGERQKG